MNASGSQLKRLRASMGIGREVPYQRNIPDPVQLPKETQPQFKAVAEMFGLRKHTPASVRRYFGDSQRYRYQVISHLGQRLIGEAETGRKAWNRKEITPEEIGFWRRS